MVTVQQLNTRTTGPTQARRTGDQRPLRGSQACCHRTPLERADREAKQRMRTRQRTPTCCPNGCATLAQRDASIGESLALASKPRNDMVSADHRPPTSPARTTSLALLRGRVPSSASRRPAPLHRHWLREVWRNHRNARRKLKWCPGPAVHHQTREGLQRQLRDGDHPGRQAPSSPNLSPSRWSIPWRRLLAARWWPSWTATSTETRGRGKRRSSTRNK